MGRDEELAALRDVSEHTHALVIAGHPGVGKSRLSAEYAAVEEAHGVTVTRVLATRASAALPLGAFATALPSLAGTSSLAPEQLFDEVARHFREASPSSTKTPLLLVDDAHLLDDISAALVLHLATTKAVLVLATIRSGEPCPDAISALWKEDVGSRIDLSPLAEESVDRLLAKVLDGDIHPPTARLLARRCEGNVLYLVELVAGLKATGTLKQINQAWTLVGEVAPSRRLTDLIESGLSGLEPSESDALAYVAFGEPLRMSEAPTGLDSAALESLESRQLVRAVIEGNDVVLRLAHPLYGDVVRSSTAVLRRRLMQRALADAIERSGSNRPDELLRAALWRLDAGDPVDPDALMDAAEIAHGRCDYNLTERLVTAALSTGGGLRAEFLMAQVEFVQSRYADAEERLARLEAETADPDDQMKVVLRRLDNLAFGLGDLDTALRVAKEHETAAVDLHLSDQFAGKVAGIYYVRGEMQRVADILEPILSDREIPGQRAISRTFLIIALAMTGRCEAAIALAKSTPPELRDLPEPFWPSWTPSYGHSYAYFMAGRPLEMRKYAEAAHAQAVASEDRWAEGALATMLGFAYSLSGDLRQADYWSNRSVTVLQGTPNPMFITTAGAHLAYVRSVRGDLAGAERAAVALDTAPWAGGMRVWWSWARAWLDVARGRLSEARDQLVDAAEAARGLSSLVREAMMLHDLARIGFADLALARLSEISREIDGQWSALRLKHVASLVAKDPTDLLECSAEFEECGALLHAAEAAADASVVFSRQGESRAAAAAHRRAAELAALCGDPATPSLAPLQVRVQLTPAELEIASLAAEGQTNKEIAERLVLSVRTIENTLHRVYNKLGLANRAELPAAMGKVMTQ